MTIPDSIRPEDLVRLRHTPAWTGQVSCIVLGDAFVFWISVPVIGWVALDFLELLPGQIEMMIA